MRHVPLILTVLAAPILLIGLATADVTPNRDFNSHFTPEQLLQIEEMMSAES